MSEAGSESTSVRVTLRIRPLNGSEKMDGCAECIQQVADTGQVVLGGTRPFTFDRVFRSDAGQEDVYGEVEPLLGGFLRGYNSTILAYGQTGSGKTYTMGTSCSSVHLQQDIGILPRAIHDLFRAVADLPTCTLTVQFLELYGEEIRDLLDPVGRSAGSVSVREHVQGSLRVVGCKEERVSTPEDMMRCLERGSLCRTTASTRMNAQSSRSHALFTVNMEMAVGASDNEDSAGAPAEAVADSTLSAKFHFVDLAGSERIKRTQAEGSRLKEGIHINKGLLALGNVISALGDEKKRASASHVPYRDSKLTRLLQDSLGGNARTLMIACVSPADADFEETLNALKYANRARNIKNKPIVNRDPHSQQLQQEIRRLRAELGTPPSQRSAGLPRPHSQPASMEARRMSDPGAGEGELQRAAGEADRLRRENGLLRSEVSQLRSMCDLLHASEQPMRQALERIVERVARLDDVGPDAETEQLALNVAQSCHDDAFAALEAAAAAGDGPAEGGDEAEEGEGEEGEPGGVVSPETESSGPSRPEGEGSDEQSGGSSPVRDPEAASEGPGEGSEAGDDSVLDAEVARLSATISAKEGLVSKLKASLEEYAAMRTYYEDRMRDMDTLVKRAEEERDRLAEGLKDVETTKEAEKLELRRKLAARLREKDQQLTTLKSRQRELAEFSHRRDNSQRQVERLQREIQRMREQRVQMQRRASKERRTVLAREAETRRQLMSVRKDARAKERKIKDLELQNRNRLRVLQQRAREMAQQKRRLESMLNRRRRRRKTTDAPAPTPPQTRSTASPATPGTARTTHSSPGPSTPHSVGREGTPRQGAAHTPQTKAQPQSSSRLALPSPGEEEDEDVSAALEGEGEEGAETKVDIGEGDRHAHPLLSRLSVVEWSRLVWLDKQVAQVVVRERQLRHLLQLEAEVKHEQGELEAASSRARRREQSTSAVAAGESDEAESRRAALAYKQTRCARARRELNLPSAVDEAALQQALGIEGGRGGSAPIPPEGVTLRTDVAGALGCSALDLLTRPQSLQDAHSVLRVSIPLLVALRRVLIREAVQGEEHRERARRLALALRAMREQLHFLRHEQRAALAAVEREKDAEMGRLVEQLRGYEARPRRADVGRSWTEPSITAALVSEEGLEKYLNLEDLEAAEEGEKGEEEAGVAGDSSTTPAATARGGSDAGGEGGGRRDSRVVSFTESEGYERPRYEQPTLSTLGRRRQSRDPADRPPQPGHGAAAATDAGGRARSPSPGQGEGGSEREDGEDLEPAEVPLTPYPGTKTKRRSHSRAPLERAMRLSMGALTAAGPEPQRRRSQPYLSQDEA